MPSLATRPFAVIGRALFLVVFMTGAATVGSAMSTAPASGPVYLMSVEGEEGDVDDGETQCYWLYDKMVCPSK
jgi:hypothetical protein